MKRIFSILLFVLITLHINSSLLIWGAYSLFQEQIAEKYCEVYLEDRLCNGQCFVRKIIIKTEQQGQKQTPPQIRLSEFSPVVAFDTALPCACAISLEKTSFVSLESSPLVGFTPSVFHPPTA
ncbi:MAG: hypothetical protein H9535_00220 [Ignavibacteria bacterium]|nr:hypothetical protein [Ignavibacteria bacterium]